MTWRQKYAIYPVILTYFLDNLGSSMLYPIFTPLFLKPAIHVLPPTLPLLVQILLYGLLIGSFPIGQCVGVPLLGEVSDWFGRKKTFYLTILGATLGYIASALALLFGSLTLLYFSRFWTGFFAGNLTICLAAVADMSHDEMSRVQNFGWLGAAGGLSFVFGILIGGAFSSLYTADIPFWIASFLSLCNLLVVLFLYHESHPTRTKFNIKQLSEWREMFKVVRIPQLKRLYIVYFLFVIAWTPALQFLPTFIATHYFVSTRMLMETFLLIGASWLFANTVLNRMLARSYHPPQVFMGCLLLLSLLFFVFLIDKNLVSLLAVLAIISFCAALSWSMGLAAMSLLATEKNQGSILGINQALSAVAGALGPAVASVIAEIRMSVVYVFIAGVCFVGFLLLSKQGQDSQKRRGWLR